MRDEHKTEAQLINEMAGLRERGAELEASAHRAGRAREIERKPAGEVVREDSERLEELVEERTTALKQANEETEAEIVERKQAERELKQAVALLERSNKELEQFA